MSHNGMASIKLIGLQLAIFYFVFSSSVPWASRVGPV